MAKKEGSEASNRRARSLEARVETLEGKVKSLEMRAPRFHSWLDNEDFKKRRKQIGTLRSVAKDLGIPFKKVHRWENGVAVGETEARQIVALFIDRGASPPALTPP